MESQGGNCLSYQAQIKDLHLGSATITELTPDNLTLQLQNFRIVRTETTLSGTQTRRHSSDQRRSCLADKQRHKTCLYQQRLRLLGVRLRCCRYL